MLRFARRVVGQKTVQPWKGVGAGRCEAEVAMLTGMKLRKTCPRSAAAWSWQMKRGGEEWVCVRDVDKLTPTELLVGGPFN